MQSSTELSYESRPERQAHLDLSTPCVQRGGNSVHFKGILAHHLDTDIPVEGGVLVAHACGHMWCSNPLHLYWSRDPWNWVGPNG